MFKPRYLSIIVVAITMVACGDKSVSNDTLETARSQARENATVMARSFRATVPAYEKLGIVPQGDSSQKPNCPQGDGWATILLVDPDTAKTVVELKCSTYSRGVGCRRDKPSQEGSCQADVPFPIPKIVN